MTPGPSGERAGWPPSVAAEPSSVISTAIYSTLQQQRPSRATLPHRHRRTAGRGTTSVPQVVVRASPSMRWRSSTAHRRPIDGRDARLRQHGVMQIPRGVGRRAAIVREASECGSRRRLRRSRSAIASPTGSPTPTAARCRTRRRRSGARRRVARVGAGSARPPPADRGGHPLPGDAPEPWHFDGHGVLQLALCRISLAEGPTEVRPRAFSESYVDVMTQQAAAPTSPPTPRTSRLARARRARRLRA